MKIMKTGHDARLALKRGIDVVANAVKLTLGPSGRTAVLGRKFQSPTVTTDGVSVSKAIELPDELENVGAKMAQEVGTLTDNNVGDGTTTATLLLQEIIKTGFERLKAKSALIDTDIDPLKIKKEIDEACLIIVEELKKRAKPISTKEEIEQVAFVSVQNREIAKIVADLFDKIGKDGVVRVEEGAFETESEVVEGMEIRTGYAHHMMANMKNDSVKELILNNVPILVTNLQIDNISRVQPILKKLNASGIKQLIIIAEEISKDVQQMFINDKLLGTFIVHAIKPSFAVISERLEDIAVKFNAKFVDKGQNMCLETLELQDLGKVEKLVADKDKTLLIGGTGDVKERIESIRTEIKKTVSQFDKKKLSERIASLAGGIGVIRVGSTSDSERDYWRLKVIDCVGATKSALEEGVVPGAGLALKEISESIKPNILTESIKKPNEQIIINSGLDIKINSDIIDPVKVTRLALQSACSLAGMVITTEIVIADKIEKDESNTRKN